MSRPERLEVWREIIPTGLAAGATMFSLDVGRDGHVWAVDRNDQVYWRDGISLTNKDGTAWVTSASVYSQDAEGEAVHTDTDFGRAKQVVLCTNGQAW
jgi:hypothetical protein